MPFAIFARTVTFKGILSNTVVSMEIPTRENAPAGLQKNILSTRTMPRGLRSNQKAIAMVLQDEQFADEVAIFNIL